MSIALVVAMTPDRVIGKDGRLPWRLPADLRRFRELTLGHAVIMGRKTHESIGAPLAGRTHIVVTRRRDYAASGCLVAHSPAEALELARGAAAAAARAGAATGAGDASADEILVIGGAEIYAAFLPRAQRLYVTFVHAQIAGDTWFPRIDPAEWIEVRREDHAADARNPYACSFAVFERRKP